jgi:hypothetical protein
MTLLQSDVGLVFEKRLKKRFRKMTWFKRGFGIWSPPEALEVKVHLKL